MIVDRVDAVMEAWDVEPTTLDTPFGPVTLVEIVPGGDGAHRWVDVTVQDPAGGDPLFRVVNPPGRISPDSDPDPLAALACVIGSAGGARVGRV